MLELNKDGYDENGFNEKGIHKDTNTRYDTEGYDYKGYDENGFNKYGYNRDGNRRFSDTSKRGIIRYNRKAPNEKNDNVFDHNGTNARGFRMNGNNIFKVEGGKGKTDRRGFNFKGINIETGTKYNKYGHDAYGYNKEGFNEYGFNEEGIHEITGTEYDVDGFNKDRINKRGFFKNGINIETDTKYDKDGFDFRGKYQGKCRYSEKTGLDYKGFNKEGIHKDTNTRFNPEGYDVDGYNELGYNNKGFDCLGINNKGINKKTGKIDKRILFALEFIESNLTMPQFSKIKRIPLKELEVMIEEIRKSPLISAKIDERLKENQDIYLGVMKAKKNKLISGEFSIKEDIDDIKEVLRFANEIERETILEILIKEAINGDISIFDYKDIFGIKEINSKLPQKIIDQLNLVRMELISKDNNVIREFSRKVHEEISRIEKYIPIYIPGEKESLGYSKNGEIKMTEITNEHRNMSKEYLKSIDEFICNKTMQETLLKIVKGEITEETIERLNSERKLKKLRNETTKLDETIEIYKEVNESKKGFIKGDAKSKDDDNQTPNL